MLRKIYLKTLSIAEKKSANYFLALVSFIESSIFPIPPDLLIVPMVLAKPSKAFIIAGIATIFSVLGGLLGYLIGYYLWIEIGQLVLNTYQLASDFDNIRQKYDQIGSFAVLIASVTPFPYKVITIFSGFVEMNLLKFLLISLIGRGARFFILAGLIFYFGDKAKGFIEKYLNLLFILVCFLLVAGFYLI